MTTIAHADPWVEVLKPSGLTRNDLKLDALADSQFGGGALPPVFLKPLREDPMRIPEYSRILRAAVLKAEKIPVDVITFGLARVGTDVRRTLVGDPLAAIEKEILKEGALLKAVAKVYLAAGKPAPALKASGLPKSVESIVAYLILAELEAFGWRQAALEKVSAKGASLFNELLASRKGGDEDSVVPAVARKLTGDVNFKKLMVGGIDLTHAVAQAKDKIGKLELKERFRFELLTPWGLIVVNGPGTDDIYKPGPHLLILDFGGNDTYSSGGATADFYHPVSVLIDVSGNDKYLSPDVALQTVSETKDRKKKKSNPSFGAGILGYGILADFEGDDVYRAISVSQGRGNFGFGLLWDVKGSDIYDCYTQCQASAAFGGGFLLDGDGQDKYSSFQQSQGFGATVGAGMLVDYGAGDDSYLSNVDQIDFPSEVDKKQNTSMSQGFGLGHRADFTDGQSMAGGVGLLIEGGGNNDFTAGFYSQGASYWYAVGILSVGEGNDRYSAVKYSQGAGVHYAVGVLNDTGGNDTYKVVQELGIGEGHDFGVGFLFDEKGDDNYQAPALALGCASANGLGFFWDKSGNDSYVAPEKLSLGCAAFRVKPPSFREYSRTIGIFLDTGGKNKLQTPLKGPGPDKRWSNPSEGSEDLADKLFGLGLMSTDF